MGRKPIPMIGKKFSHLRVLRRAGSDKYSKPLYECKCDCGRITNTLGNFLRIGHTKSCGCLTTAIHHLSKHPLHGIRNSIKSRCYNPACKSFQYYGEKGIKVCDIWKDSFLEFYNWALQNGWEKGLTIDRINPKGNYEPSNCRFLTRSQNSKRRHATPI